jgi:hypothetical protein
VNAGKHILTITLDDPPFAVGLIAGDFLCCLRSSLDHLDWQGCDVAGRARTIYVGPEEPANVSSFTECYLGKAGEVLPDLLDAL